MTDYDMAPNHLVASRLANKALIIFDWDGTLMDSIGLIVESMQVAAKNQGFDISDEAVKGIIGLSLHRGIEVLFPNASAAQKEGVQKSYAQYYIANSHKTPFFAGIEPMFQSLKDNGKILAVATGKKRAGLDRVMASSQSKHYFSVTKCADESVRARPLVTSRGSQSPTM